METPVLLNLLVSLILLVCAVTAKHNSSGDYVPYGSLEAGRNPCSIPGSPYYKCTQGAMNSSGSPNPYQRDCSKNSSCRTGGDLPPPTQMPSTKPPSPPPEVKSSPPPPPSLESPPPPVSIQPPPSPLPTPHSSPPPSLSSFPPPVSVPPPSFESPPPHVSVQPPPSPLRPTPHSSPPPSLSSFAPPVSVPPLSFESPPPPVSVQPPPSPPPPSHISPPQSLSSSPPPVSVPPPPLFPSPPLLSTQLSPPTASHLLPPTVMSSGPPISGPGIVVTSPSTPSNSSSRSRLIVGISVAVIIVALSLFVLLIVFYIKKKRPQPHEEGEHPSEGLNSPLYHVVNVSSSSTTSGLPLSSSSDATGGSTSNDMQPQNTLTRSLLPNRVSNCTVFTYEDLLVATDGFPDSNLIGEGGFGYVHRGVLPDGREVAVKQLKSDSGQGDLEFQAEVGIISRVHHKNLVSLVGYCIAGEKRLLVYDFVPNKTLDFHLHGNGQVSMNWTTRFKVALSSAKGLAYLHEDCHPKIIHRDIKASNILLDLNFDAQVSDFGLAKFFSETNTHITTRVMGTFGYLAPEYASSGKLTEKSDVFSFGVLLLELITGLRPIAKIPNSDDCIVDWARPLLAEALKKGKYQSLVDRRLLEYDHKQMERMIACAAASIRHLARLRPGMGQIVRVLEGGVSIDELNHGLPPGHSVVLESPGKSSSEKKKHTSDDFEGNHQNGSSGISKIVADFALKLGLRCGR